VDGSKDSILALQSGHDFAVVSSTQVMLFGFAIIGIFFLLFGVFWAGWRLSHRPPSLSPYSNMPLRRCTDLSYYSVERILRFLYELQDYENRIFDLRKASFCRETGRIFKDSITWYDTIDVDWNFLQKRYPGNYVSWGSLTHEQQLAVRSKHTSLEGFETEHSSPTPSPRGIEPQYALGQPGPLYVDIDTFVLLGWKIVPGTELELLFVQRPKPPERYQHLDSY
jgi:hypothetical protein